MKCVKLFALALGLIGLASCGSDEPAMNSESGVKVQMGQATMTVKESAGLVKIPVTVTGKTNGVVKVEVKAEGTGKVPCMPFVEGSDANWSGNYIMTDNVVRIGEGETEGAIEIRFLDDKDETGDRELTLTITSVDGATLGEPVSTVITVVDNESLPLYDVLQGAWKLDANDGWDGSAISEEISIVGFPEGSKEYNAGYVEVRDWGFAGSSFIAIVEDVPKDAKTCKITVPLGQSMGVYNGQYKIGLFTVSGTSVVANPPLVWVFDKETSTITVPESDSVFLYAWDLQGNGLGGLANYKNIHITR